MLTRNRFERAIYPANAGGQTNSSATRSRHSRITTKTASDEELSFPSRTDRIAKMMSRQQKWSMKYGTAAFEIPDHSTRYIDDMFCHERFVFSAWRWRRTEARSSHLKYPELIHNSLTHHHIMTFRTPHLCMLLFPSVHQRHRQMRRLKNI